MMRFLIMLEQTETGFAIQVPDLAIVTVAETISGAKLAAREAIRVNLEAYEEAGMPVPPPRPASVHMEDPDNRDLVFTYVEVEPPFGRLAA